jgi:cysteine-rich repeat protein
VHAGEGCDTRCDPVPITAFNTGDECCPEGADATEDGDCTAVCDNGAIEEGETCDPISSCVQTCSSSNACLSAVLSGAADDCTSECELVPVTACDDGDDCCPSGCTETSDDDCSADCGDGVIDRAAGETCEAGSATPCPANCNDNDPCTRDLRTGSAANCNVVCTHTAIVLPQDGDNCCPEDVGANANNDDDCDPECGNGVREGSELCDGNCPAACSDGMACTADQLVGSAGSCNARCSYPEITAPMHGDGCCPEGVGANANNDDNCPSVCGNNAIEPGELCDDGGTVPNDGCGATCQIEADQQMCLSLLPMNTTCGQCNCLECRSATVACYGSASATANARCSALVACGREKGCSGSDCYCGTASDWVCLFGGGNGPCRPEVEAAAGSTDPVTIQLRADDTNYALGRANALATCARAECEAACDL